MEIKAALRLGPGRLVAFTGAGGKSAVLRRLAQELPVSLLTTSTHLGRDQDSLASQHLVVHAHDELAAIPARLAAAGSLLVTGELDEVEGKWQGLPVEWIDELQALTVGSDAAILVEADGARGRLIKAPAGHEPAIPSRTNLVVPIVGLGALGQPLSDQVGHRVERLESVTGLRRGSPIGLEQVAKLLTSPQGSLQGVPPSAEVRVLLNGAKTEALVESGRELAGRALNSARIRAIVLADTGAMDPVVASIGRTAGIVLAAGGASRMGELKQVMDWRGQPLVRRALKTAQAAGLDPVVLVIGAEADRVRAAVAGLDVEIVENGDWRSGQSSSMRAGLAAARRSAEAAVFLLADMPMVSEELVRRLVRAHQSSLAPIVAPSVDGHRGNPVLFDRSTFEALEQVEGDQGGRALFDRYSVAWVPADSAAAMDIDSPGDWQE
ncbi:MAG: selenium cofactor biosynthesis protein YqeC [Anaerolineales bacterium]